MFTFNTSKGSSIFLVIPDDGHLERNMLGRQ